MKSTSIHQIYYDFRAALDNKADTTIEFYNKNALLLNNVTSFKDRDELEFYIHIMNHYVYALNQKRRYNQIIDHIDSKLPLIDSETIRLNAEDLKDDWYYGILFTKGMACNNLRDYKASNPIFKGLAKHDPENEQYKIWLDHSEHSLKMGVIKIVMIVAAVLFIPGMILVNKYIHSLFIRSLIFYSDLILIIGLGIYEFSIKRNYRKKTSK